MHIAKDWPVLTSYDDLSAYAKTKGGRIPNEFELRLFLDKYNVGYEEGANVGFRNWHPLPYVFPHVSNKLLLICLSPSATAGGPEFNGRGSNGGVWEWSSTVMEEHEGFVGTSIFAGYSSDFFDTKHQVVVSAPFAFIGYFSRIFAAGSFVCDVTEVIRQEDCTKFLSAQLSLSVGGCEGCL